MSDHASRPDWGNGAWGVPTPPPVHWVYAGFWWRFLAHLIDAAIIGVANRLLRRVVEPSIVVTYGPADFSGQAVDVAWVPEDGAYHLHHSGLLPHIHWHGSGLYELIAVLMPALYFVLCEQSRWQATPGKLACRLRVTDMTGQRIGFGRALGRFAGKYLSYLLCGVGFLMAGWTLRKQALHDLMASTLVIRARRTSPELVQPPR